MTVTGQNRENPVIKRVADAGVLKYAGKYYLGGVATHGDFYVSSDLTHWDQRIHVFDLDNKWTHGTGAATIKFMPMILLTAMACFICYSVSTIGDQTDISCISPMPRRQRLQALSAK